MNNKVSHSAISEYICRWTERLVELFLRVSAKSSIYRVEIGDRLHTIVENEEGDVPGWVLVVLMTTGLVTAIWAIAAPRISSILRNSLDSMNNVR